LLKIPFSFFPRRIVLGLAGTFKNAGGFLSAFFPALHEDLVQAQITESPRSYMAIALSVFITNALTVFVFMQAIAMLAKINLLFISVLFTFVVGLASFFTIIFYPRILSGKRKKLVENQLIPAVRQILIELKSGVPLFNAMTSAANGYGEVSVEFRKIVNKINSGVPEIDALSEATRTNPSMQFRKVLWQIQNALKVGSDVGDSLESILDELMKEKIDDIHRYGQELSPWAMLYMMFAVVVPSLGVTMIIVISSFLGIEIPTIIFPAVLAFLIGFQLFFMSFISSRRPLV